MNQVFIVWGERKIWKGILDFIPKIGEQILFTYKGQKVFCGVKNIRHSLDLNKVYIFTDQPIGVGWEY